MSPRKAGMSPEPDDTDARFRELIREGFGADVRRGHPPVDPGAADARDRAAGRPRQEPFSMAEALEGVDGEPDDEADRFVPPVPGPIGRPQSPVVVAGAALLVIGVLSGIAALFGARIPQPMGVVAALGAALGLGLLLFSLPRRRDSDDPGIRL